MIRKSTYKKVIFPIFLAAIFTGFILFIVLGPVRVYAQELSKGVKPQKIGIETLSKDFINTTLDFSVSLLKNSYSQTENILISPVSVALALGMTANGADGNTLKQFNSLLGGDNLSLEQLNKFYYNMSSEFQNDNSNKIKFANSIWYRNDKNLNINNAFLQSNANFYKAAAYKSDFTSPKTVTDINNWVKLNTDGLINKIIDKIDRDTVMYLFNTVLFNAEWKKAYSTNDIYNKSFLISEKNYVSVPFMHSNESYISDGKAEGFIKPYKGGKYSYVAVLPNKETTIDDYIRSLDGKSFSKLLGSSSDEYAAMAFPKYKFDYSISLVDPLKNLGLSDCFIPDKADFSKMASAASGNIYINDVFHKTYISVDELGTKAGAVTKVEMRVTSVIVQPREVIFDRPFMFAVIDNETCLPLFLGTVRDPSKG